MTLMKPVSGGYRSFFRIQILWFEPWRRRSWVIGLMEVATEQCWSGSSGTRTRASVSKHIDRWFGSTAKTWGHPTMSKRLENGGRDSGDPSLEERRDLEPVHRSARAETDPAAQLDHRHLLRHRRSSIGRGGFFEGGPARLQGLHGRRLPAAEHP